VIPVRLSMRNFMCYRDNVAPLNFEGIHVACLCGDNGSGKSTIFDAMAWALWGEASRGKSNDDLIFSGQNDMEVELDFLIGEDRYRVIRKQVRAAVSRPGQSVLDLQVYDGATFKSIAEHTKTMTQEKILDLLHLDYTTFINSAMILQGRADEFSNKRPGERKEILANILDLSFYDQLEQQSRAYAENRKSESLMLERDITAMVSKMGAKDGLEIAGKAILDELASVEGSRKSSEDAILVQRKRKEALISHKESLNLVLQQLNEKERELGVWEKRLAESKASIDRFNQIIESASEIQHGYSEYKTIAGQEDTLNEKLKKSLELVQRKNKLEGLISAAQSAFGNERKILLTRVSELTAKFARLPGLKQQLSELVNRQSEIHRNEEEIEAKRQLVNQLTGLISKVSTLNSEMYTAVEDIKKKLTLIGEADATCPLCETELGPDGRVRIERKLSMELEQKLAQSRENVTKLAGYKTELAALEKELKQKESALKSERDSAKQKVAITEKDTQEAISAGEELDGRKVALQKLEEDINNRNFAVDEQKALAVIVHEQDALGYDAAAHKAITERRIALQKFDQLNKDSADAILRLESQQKVKTDAEGAIAQLQKDIADYRTRRSETEKAMSGLPEIEQYLQTLERQQKELAVREREVRDRLAESKEVLRQLSLLASERAEKEVLLQKSKEEESVYSELARDFSKKGIQALIIEEALPEIANEANLLLGKMTDNRMSLSLESQRGTKKGDVIETLDITISDELGTRGYDMYSGGEAFRIDLALRIAISRLLVRRSGATMPILIIDEGFGTQDSAGLEKLVETINAIRDDFEKIFIITHLEELKDKFPVLINIVKTPEGSTISISD
jgi:DNA repair protein SbcC/Rad50